MPDVYFDIRYVWDAFLFLNPYRSTGFGIGLIPLVAVREYVDTFGIFDDQETFFVLIRATDIAYVNAANAKEGSFVPSKDKVDPKALSEKIKMMFRKNPKKKK